MEFDREPGEVVVREGRANMQRGIETVGGRLWLTDRRLVFRTHFGNVQRGTTSLGLRDIASLEPVWTKFLGIIPLAPNSLAVKPKVGEELRFVLPKRMEWKAAIKKQMAG